MVSSINKELKKLQKRLDELKIKANKPKTIDDCTSKKQLKQFTVKQLTDWLKKNNVDTEKSTKKYKDELIKIIWNSLEDDFESEYSSDSDSDSSDSDSDSSDSDSDSSDSDSD